MADSKPNIVFIIADHQAFYGHDRDGEYNYKWENFERFAARTARASTAPILFARSVHRRAAA